MYNFQESSSNPAKYFLIGILLIGIIVALVALPLFLSKAQSTQNISATTTTAGFGDTFAAGTLCSAGLGECPTASQQSSSQTTSSSPGGGIFSGLFGGSSTPRFDPIISVVSVPGDSAVYRIVNGQKHSIPTTEIFYSYGFNLNIVQDITVQELNKYPRARLFIVEGDETQQIYYLTEGGMIRPLLNDKVFYSYGDRKEDVITINQKEFNYYPRNKFVFVIRPDLNREVYQITGGIKRYLTPVAIERMGILATEVAPVNQVEIDSYPVGEPIIF